MTKTTNQVKFEARDKILDNKTIALMNLNISRIHDMIQMSVVN